MPDEKFPALGVPSPPPIVSSTDKETGSAKIGQLETIGQLRPERVDIVEINQEPKVSPDIAGYVKVNSSEGEVFLVNKTGGVGPLSEPKIILPMTIGEMKQVSPVTEAAEWFRNLAGKLIKEFGPAVKFKE